ncbi:class F sortase [Polaromonas sp.]|nr:class F sortase [Candidatus Saccharibacteria bacterium]
MSDRPRLGLDNPAFQGRLRQPTPRLRLAPRGPIRQLFSQPVTILSKPATPAVAAPAIPQMQPMLQPQQQLRPMQPDIRPAPPKPKPQIAVAAAKPEAINIIQPQPFAQPAHPKLQQSRVLHRQAVRHPARTPESTPAKRSKLQYGLVAMAGFVFLIGLFVSLLTLQTNHQAKTQVAALASTTQQSDGAAAPDAPPTETKPTTATMASYKVAPDLPRQIIIPKLYVYSRVRPMGVNTKNELQAPGNIFDAGWYNASAKPGAGAGSGAMVIDGHVHGPTLPGVFANLKKLVAGDTIQVVRGDGKTFTYTVVKLQNVDAANLDIGSALTSAVPGQPALNLITCGGPYDKATGDYTQRTIVYAVQSDLTADKQ